MKLKRCHPGGVYVEWRAWIVRLVYDPRHWEFTKGICYRGGLWMFRYWHAGPIEVWRWFPIPWQREHED